MEAEDDDVGLHRRQVDAHEVVARDRLGKQARVVVGRSARRSRCRSTP
jgi:hypothetical protein